ncbi:diguanylate cyclase [Rossellomorea aquimaris]|uniref:sensor domain-containing diguanylate cyclase n=1 Tax=Rossellomorea aquimaris TaxID=189382 RepID=UPI001CD28925|nr:sensor domain-containing diguanylate cyclase [Rossellomorea aquimaris]MCA1056887.1 diguanylate cyclase [Rossellomorea aquimaris]
MTILTDRLHLYKSKLFDHILEDSRGSQQSFTFHSWLILLEESIEIDKALLYVRRNGQYCLLESHGREGGPTVGPHFAGSFMDTPYYSIDRGGAFCQSGFLFQKDDVEAYVLILEGNKGTVSVDADWLSGFWEASNQYLTHLWKIQEIYEEERRYRELFKVTEVFHSNRDVQTLLVQIIETLGEVFPEDSFQILLSNDRYDFGSLPIKAFDFERANPSAMQAFVNGSIEVDEDSMLYAPLKGKQGIYGVLEVGSASHTLFTEQKMEFIKLLAYTAGSALENAKLYEQSKRLISDLQLINETSHQLNVKFRLSDTLQFLKHQIQRSFQPHAVGFVLKENGVSVINEKSSTLFFSEEGAKYIAYVDERFDLELDSVFLGDVRDRIVQPDYLSLMAVPMVQNEVLIGFCIVLHREPYMFSFDMYKLLQSFIHHSALAITNSILREELEQMVITDHMTKLYARHYLDGKMEKAMKEDELGTLLLIDIDDFKAVNDNYGHQIGDEVLIQVANLIKDSLGESGLAARWGGEELAIYLPRTERASGLAIAEGIVERIAHSTRPRVTLSCGLSAWGKQEATAPESVKELVKKADEALYLAKNHGKNQVVEDTDHRLHHI